MHRRWECLIINDGSTDDTERIARDLAARDERIRYLTQPNRGLARTRNRGIDEAKGAFIQFLDADDVILPQKLQLQLDALSRGAPPSIVYCRYRFGLADDVYTPPEIPVPLNSRLDTNRALQQLALDWETRLSIPVHCYLFDTKLFRDAEVRFDSSLPTHEDWDCWMTLLSRRPPLVYVDEPLAIYRLNNSSMCQNTAGMRRGFLRAIRKQRRAFRHDPEMERILTEKLRITEGLYPGYSLLDGLKTQIGRLAGSILSTVGRLGSRSRTD